MKETIKNALILFVITLVAGALLGIVYEVTKEPIRVQKALAEQRANQEAYPSATFTEYEAFDKAEADAILAGDENYAKVSIDDVKVAEIGGAPVGYVLQITSMGYGDDITWTLGITNEGQVNGISLPGPIPPSPAAGKCSLLTRSMAAVLEEQGALEDAAGIYRELIEQAGSDEERDELNAKLESLTRSIPAEGQQHASVIGMLEELADHLEQRARG